jgi:superfamily II DNA or RNA helicase
VELAPEWEPGALRGLLQSLFRADRNLHFQLRTYEQGRQPHPIQEQILQYLRNPDHWRLEGDAFEQVGVVIPTGTGKTLVAARHSREQMASGYVKRVLFVVQNKAILDQARDVFQRELGLTSEQVLGLYGEHTQDTLLDSHQAVFTTRTTLGKRWGDLRPWTAEGKTLVIWDEAHHVMSPEYQAILDAMRPEGFRFLWLSATLWRNDGVFLLGDILGNRLVAGFLDPGQLDRLRTVSGEAKELLIRHLAMRQTATAMSHGYLTAIQGLHVITPQLGNDALGLNQVSRREAEDAGVEESLLRDWAKRVRDQRLEGVWDRGLVFVPGIAYANLYRDWLNQHESSLGKFQTFHSKESDVDALNWIKDDSEEHRYLIVVDKMNEGYDNPGINSISVLKFIDAPRLIIQMVGRGLRLAAQKTGLRIIDYSGLMVHYVQYLPLMIARPSAGGEGEEGRSRRPFDPVSPDGYLQRILQFEPDLLRQIYDMDLARFKSEALGVLDAYAEIRKALPKIGANPNDPVTSRRFGSWTSNTPDYLRALVEAMANMHPWPSDAKEALLGLAKAVGQRDASNAKNHGPSAYRLYGVFRMLAETFNRFKKHEEDLIDVSRLDSREGMKGMLAALEHPYIVAQMDLTLDPERLARFQSEALGVLGAYAEIRGATNKIGANPNDPVTSRRFGSWVIRTPEYLQALVETMADMHPWREEEKQALVALAGFVGQKDASDAKNQGSPAYRLYGFFRMLAQTFNRFKKPTEDLIDVSRLDSREGMKGMLAALEHPYIVAQMDLTLDPERLAKFRSEALGVLGAYAEIRGATNKIGANPNDPVESRRFGPWERNTPDYLQTLVETMAEMHPWPKDAKEALLGLAKAVVQRDASGAKNHGPSAYRLYGFFRMLAETYNQNRNPGIPPIDADHLDSSKGMLDLLQALEPQDVYEKTLGAYATRYLETHLPNLLSPNASRKKANKAKQPSSDELQYERFQAHRNVLQTLLARRNQMATGSSLLQLLDRLESFLPFLQADRNPYAILSEWHLRTGPCSEAPLKE